MPWDYIAPCPSPAWSRCEIPHPHDIRTGLSDCLNGMVNAYLSDGVVPAEDKACDADAVG